MQNIKDLMKDILKNGTLKDTRTGNVISTWNKTLEWDLQKGFPTVTSKKLAWNSVVGELLWFLSGSESLKDLRIYTFGKDVDKWTIWTDDTKRWHNTNNRNLQDKDFVGALYPVQWRNYNYSNVDQIKNIVDGLKNNPNERNHIVMAWNPEAISKNEMSLKPCHLGFQCYVENGKLNLNWWQRSCDVFLGLCFNIASYALLQHLLASWTGLEVGKLSCWIGDTHIYENHKEAVATYLNNEEHPLPTLELPKGSETLEDVLKLTSVDFKDSLKNYVHEGPIKAPLSVGK